MMNTSVENYLINGCMRCPLGGSSDCKVHDWQTELVFLRGLILQTGIKEVCKWGVPVFVYNEKNVISLSAFKDYCSVSFFKGSLLKDAKSLLVKPGLRSQAVRLFKFKNIDEIHDIKNEIEAYIYEAIEIEKSGLKLEITDEEEPYPLELEELFQKDPFFRSAFETLTPGRQRGYLIYFNQAKQTKTRISRIEKYMPMILNGLGLHDKYKARK